MRNIAPSCRTCNTMKGAMEGRGFLKMCYRICINNKITNGEFWRKNKEFEKFITQEEPLTV